MRSLGKRVREKSLQEFESLTLRNMKDKAKAVIFDMDGVITDTQDLIAAAESALLAEYGIMVTPEEITARYAGTTSREMMPHVFASFNIEMPELPVLIQQRKERIDAVVTGNVRAIPGTVEFIRELHERGVPIAVGSGSRTPFIRSALSELGIFELFQNTTGSDEVANGKPAPDTFLLAAERLGIAPEYCLVIEDGKHGMVAAQQAGMRCIGLIRSGEYSRETHPADAFVKNLSEVRIEDWLHV